MKQDKITRRFFIGGAASFGAFAGCRFFETSGEAALAKPNVRFGVVSDIHIRYIGEDGDKRGWGENGTFKRTLAWFRDQGADAVMVVGDMADLGWISQLEAVAEAWYSVFPNDRAPDGRKVEKLFVYGNHDYEGHTYGDHTTKVFKDAATIRRNVLRTDMKGNWERIFHEAYAPFSVKNVKGYAFLGQHWDDGRGFGTPNHGPYGRFGLALENYLAEHGKALDPKRPFFYYQHPHPAKTCYGAWAWGHDNGRATKALSAYPNAIAFSGHSHYSLTDERSIWQEAFTSIGTSSLRYTGLPYDSRAPHGYENSSAPGKGAAAYDMLKATKKLARLDDCRQGMLVSVYDDRVVIRRREFKSNLDLGSDWTMPLPNAEPKPFAFAARAKKAVAPAFASDAKLTVKNITAKTRRTKARVAESCAAVALTIPSANACAAGRVHEFEIAAIAADGSRTLFHALAEGFNQARSHAYAQKATGVNLPYSRLPKGRVRLEVTPLDCWGTRGRPLVASCEPAAKGAQS